MTNSRIKYPQLKKYNSKFFMLNLLAFQRALEGLYEWPYEIMLELFRDEMTLMDEIQLNYKEKIKESIIIKILEWFYNVILCIFFIVRFF